MALAARSSPTGELLVVGFSGSPIEGAAGLAQPVFQDSAAERYFAGDPDDHDHPDDGWDSTAMREFEERGLVSFAQRPAARIRGGLFLYADREFARCSHDFAGAGPRPLAWDDRARTYLCYLHRDEALRAMRRWGTNLVERAHSLVASPDSKAVEHETALAMGRSARFCAPPPEWRWLREEAYLVAAAAMVLLRQPTDALVDNALRDFDRRTADSILFRAAKLAKGQSASAYRRSTLSPASWAVVPPSPPTC